jgi:hypothetical protein
MSVTISASPSATDLSAVKTHEHADSSAGNPRLASHRKHATMHTKAGEKRMQLAFAGFLGLAVAFAVPTSGAIAADSSLSAMEKVDLPVSPANALETISDFDGRQNWHPAIGGNDIAKGKGNAQGTLHVLTTKEGAKITEVLLSDSDNAMTDLYRTVRSKVRPTTRPGK